MLSTPRRWMRKRLLSSKASVMRSLLSSRRHFLWILFFLLIVCIAIQTFVAQQARVVKLMALLRSRSPVNLYSVSPLPMQKDFIQLERTANPHHQNEGNGDSADHMPLEGVEKKFIQFPISFNTEESRVSPGKLLLPIERDGKSLTPLQLEKMLADKTFIHTPTLKALMNIVHPSAKCAPKSHIVFLKTHKTASSSILNILYRYGESRNLTFALPLKKHSQLFYPHLFSSRFVEGVSSGRLRSFHILCNHMRFRKSEVAKVMPGDTFYFSILRHPVAMMESIFTYYKSIPAFRETHSLDDFLESCRENYNPSLSNNHYAHNVLAFDFGFYNHVADGAQDLDERATKAITAIEQDFHLVLISDYFEESLILLKHALCWSLEDVVSFRLNSRNEQTRNRVLPVTAEKIKRWNALDWRIYQHFNVTFWHKVESLVGQEKMKREISQLRVLQAKLANTCLKDGGPVDPSKVKDSALKPFQYGAAVIQGYNLNSHLDSQTKATCQRLITPELQYTNQLYMQQFPEAAAKFRHTTKSPAPAH